MNGKFAEQEILEKTGGKGVDLIFNTVESTPYKLQSFIRCVAENGRVVEFERQKRAIEHIGECMISYTGTRYCRAYLPSESDVKRVPLLSSNRRHWKPEKRYRCKNELENVVPRQTLCVRQTRTVQTHRQRNRIRRCATVAHDSLRLHYRE